MAIPLNPGTFAGATLRQWFSILRDNHFAVDLPYWPRAAVVTAGSLFNSAAAFCEKLMYGRRIKGAKIESPIFVLGVWRSGTTHLQNLLCLDRRFGYANYFEVLYPNTFLCTAAWLRPLLQLGLPETRFQDNVRVTTTEPGEDEVATSILARRSMLMSWSFFRNQDVYDRLLTFREASLEETAAWRAALLLFVKKLTVKYGRPLVLKSPGHTGRIRLLLEMFPDAKFVNIHRHPYEVYQSSLHTYQKVTPLMALQRPEPGDGAERNLRQYAELCEAFFEERELIPRGHLHEMRYDDLTADPLKEMEQLYDALDLPDFEVVRGDLEAYLRGLRDYERNRFPDLPTELRERITREWSRSFEEWGYDPELPELASREKDK